MAAKLNVSVIILGSRIPCNINLLSKTWLIVWWRPRQWIWWRVSRMKDGSIGPV